MTHGLVSVCENCGRTFTTERNIVCPYCGGLVKPVFEIKWRITERKTGIWRYEQLLPRLGVELSLGEGQTPLIRAGRSINWDLEVWFKDETRNPTGSFRDRAAALMVSDAVSLKAKRIILASDGNTGASVAAYAARAGIGVTVYLPKWVEEEKILLMKSFGAKVILEDTSLDKLLEFVEKRSLKEGLYNASSTYNYLSIQGLKTIAFEIYEWLGDTPNAIYLPLGSGLTLLSLYQGFRELVELGLVSRLPRLIGVESCGRPLFSSILYNTRPCGEEPLPGLRYTKPTILEHVLKILEEYGDVIVVSKREVIDAAEKLSREEGLFAEVSSAVSFAGFLKNPEDKSIVLITSHGLKSPEAYAGARRHRFTEVFPGVTKRLILELLNESPGLTGYEVWRRLGVKISPQAVYQHLRELAEKGLVKAVEVEGHKRYYVVK
ncbi:pyridoxal-phosphate dependent enzyme [Thermogladius sp. 4427co]|uniref:pyridoxal-phosphate dependent enzyme n=1 Tax=Thermogladius sp. 4427co TaxID=3450718 RepID=UPI003F794BFC